jgi:hypothetical protein
MRVSSSHRSAADPARPGAAVQAAGKDEADESFFVASALLPLPDCAEIARNVLFLCDIDLEAKMFCRSAR